MSSARLSILLFAAFNVAALSAGEVRHEFLPHPDDPNRRVEHFWTAREGDGPWPAMLYVHGHQFPERPGARRYLAPPLLESPP